VRGAADAGVGADVGTGAGAAARACAACLARTWLIARLAGSIEIARHQRRRLREILALSEEQLVAGLGGARAGAIAEEFERLDVDGLREAVERSGLEAVCRHDPAYPARLCDLEDAPAALFVAGGIDRLEGLVGGDLEQGPRAVAVVGTRRASADGLEVSRALGRGLAAAGVTVVSGMALGVDSAAHAGALESSGRTVAVLAGGADVPYPPSKTRLHGLIGERGCVVGELPPGFVALRWCFPARNRIIAALGQMTIVVEAARRSGSLITAEIAIDIGREVGAVPGPVMAWRAAGTNALLRDGATVIRDAADALDGAVGVDRHEAAVLHLEPRLRALLGAVADGRDTLAALAGAPAEVAPMLAALTELELLGHLRRVAGGRYVVIPP
jgi:DNA processing protein